MVHDHGAAGVVSAPLTVTAEQRAHWQVCGGGYGIHWPDIDEDLSTDGLLRGTPAPQPSGVTINS